MALELRHLRVVCAIADAGSLTKAAAALGLSQPTLTAQLQRIERLVGGQLFVRSGKGTVPTALGTYVVARAHAVLPAVDDLERDALWHAAADHDLHVIRHGAAPGPFMARFIKRLRALAPSSAVTLLTENASAVLADLVATHRLETAAFREYPGYELAPHPAVERHVVATEPIFALLPLRHPLAGQDEVALADLAGEEWVLPPLDDNRLREYLVLACGRDGFAPRVVHEADASGAREMVSSGQGIGIAQATFRSTPGVLPRPIAGTPLRTRHVLAWHPDGPIAPMSRELLALAHDCYADAVQTSPVYQQWLEQQGA